MYSKQVQEYVVTSRWVGPLSEATHQGVCGRPGDGPFVAIWLKVNDGLVQDAATASNGCPPAIAAGKCACEWSLGKSLQEVRDLGSNDLLTLLGGLPEGKEGYAEMAVDAIVQAVEGES